MKAKRKTKQTRPCEKCNDPAHRLFRIKTDDLDWTLVCKDCYDQLSTQAGYTYGGTWTSRRRD